MSQSGCIARRYRVEAELGRGGMAEVLRVLDERTGARLALKRLTVPQNQTQLEKLTTLFEREFYALSQLRHPHIVEVHDYGHDNQTPYYTMELLDGQDLKELAPMPWQSVCEVLRSVCSALAMLHSRRQVHRDISSRNVRRTANGLTKLIDFGALAPMGPTAHIVGTPAFIAPESVNAQSLDGRTDLYSVGALAYWLLTGVAAYPARAMSQLRELWRSSPTPVASHCPEVPEALGQLVMSLLSLDPGSRPVAAAEVMKKVCAIAGLADEQNEAALAYLITPSLVGRPDVQLTFRRRTLRAKQARGSATMIEGLSGLGRSRLLASIALEAKMLGILTLRVNAALAADDGKSLLTALTDELQANAGDVARETALPFASVLGLVVPAFYGTLPNPAALATFDEPRERDARVQEAFVEWFKALVARQSVAVYVDDVHRADRLSIGVLSQLAQLSATCPLLLVTTNLSYASPASRGIRRLRERSKLEWLKPLRRADVDSLLKSVFGDVPGLFAAADWVFQLGRGSPRSSLQLAQHLVDKGIARYADGAWILPASLSGLELPKSFEQTLEARLAELSPTAMAIARALALSAANNQLAMSAVVALLRDRVGSEIIYQAIEELSGAGFAVVTGKSIEIREAAIKQAVVRRIAEGTRVALHWQLADLYLREEHPPMLLVTYHLHAAGDDDAAYARFAAALPQIAHGPEQALFRSPVGVSLTEWALQHAKRSGASPRALYVWRKQLLMLAASVDANLARYATETLDSLYRDCGLVHYDQLDARLDASARLGVCFELAMTAHTTSAEAERGLDPLNALRELALCSVSLAAVYAIAWDCDGLRKLAKQLAPAGGLSPALVLVSGTLRITLDTVVRGDGVMEQRRALLAALRMPVAGMGEQTRETWRLVHTFFLSLEEAVIGNPAALDHANEVAGQARFASLAWQARMMYFLATGDAASANACRQQKELLAAQTGDSDHDLIISMLYEVVSYATLGDLLGVARLLPHFERRATMHPGWRPWSCYTRALYRSICGEHKRCLQDLELALTLVGPGEHAAWQHIIVLYIETLVRRGDASRALDVANDALAAIDRAQLRMLNPTLFDLAMASALRANGHTEQALALMRERLSKDVKRGVQGVALGLVHEALARLTAECGDRTELRHHLEQLATLYKHGRHSGLLSRYERVVAETSDGIVLQSGAATDSSAITTQRAFPMRSNVATAERDRLMSIEDERQRGREILDTLVRSSSAIGGFLYSVDRASEAVLAASEGMGPEPEIDKWVADYARETLEWLSLSESITETVSDAPESLMQTMTTGGGYLQRFRLLTTHDGEQILVAIAVLCARDGALLRVSNELLRFGAEVLSRGGKQGMAENEAVD